MLSKNQQKIIRSLHSNKGRSTHRMFIIEGTKPVQELLDSSLKVTYLCYSDPENPVAAREDAVEVPEKVMAQISAMKTAPGVLAVAKYPKWFFSEVEKPSSQFVLYLDGIRDPGNLGTILRTANWFGLDEVYCSPDTVEAFNPKVVQASMGSAFRMKCWSISLSELCELSGLEALGMDLQGKSLFEAELAKGIFVIGSESHGIREEVRVHIASNISIPGKGDTESLNAAMSAGILLAEWSRRLG